MQSARPVQTENLCYCPFSKRPWLISAVLENNVKTMPHMNDTTVTDRPQTNGSSHYMYLHYLSPDRILNQYIADSIYLQHKSIARQRVIYDMLP